MFPSLPCSFFPSQWIEETIGETIPDGFEDGLKDGKALCKYVALFMRQHTCAVRVTRHVPCFLGLLPLCFPQAHQHHQAWECEESQQDEGTLYVHGM